MAGWSPGCCSSVSGASRGGETKVRLITRLDRSNISLPLGLAVAVALDSQLFPQLSLAGSKHLKRLRGLRTDHLLAALTASLRLARLAHR